MPIIDSKLQLISTGKKLSIDVVRETSNKRGYGYRWQKVRAKFLQENPLCVCQDCKLRLVPLPADVVDHIIPHKGDMTLFWDSLNWQPMNHVCHNKKTACEDGGFGNGWTLSRT